MGKALKRMLVFILIVIAVVILVPALLILRVTLTDYRPDDMEKIILAGKPEEQTIRQDTLTALTWNIGYCSLGKEEDFFYDGGKGVRPSEKKYLQYQDGVLKTLFRQGDFDFLLLQEVDKNSRRSYHFDQAEAVGELLPLHSLAFAKNYDVPFVPVPWTNPMGKVIGGIVSMSRYIPQEASRFALPGDASWPAGLFMLDRCFILERFIVEGGHELVLVNSHLSAFDDGSRRKQQLAVLKEALMKEYLAGNYVVAGGDWNLSPPGYSPEAIGNGYRAKTNVPLIDGDFLPADWHWAYDPSIPTNRELKAPYHEGETFTTIIDFFVCSPNIEVLETRTLDLGFRHSDHHPVTLKFRIRL